MRRTNKRAMGLLMSAAAAAGASRATGQAFSLPTFGPTVYNVTVANPSINSGVAASSGSADNAAAINAYISYCSSHGGGTVQIPAGTFNSNTLTLLSNVDLQLSGGAVLYNATPLNTLIQTTGSSNTNMEISGSGIINGGATTATGSNKLVILTHVSTLAVTGVTIENAANEHLVPEFDSNVTLSNITIADPGTLAANGNNYLSNTDAIDYSGSNFTIRNCNINAGDDDIVAKTAGAACSNIVITNCAIGAGHGISVGGGNAFGLSNMNVSNITFNGTSIGLRVKAQDASGSDGGGGTLHPLVNVTYSNIAMNNVPDPIVVDSFYNGGNNFPTSPAQTNHAVDATTPMWENIGFNNVNITGASNGGLLYDLNTTPGNLVGLSFNKVSISSSSAMNLWWGTNVNLSGLTVNHAINQQDLTNVTPAGAASITWNNTGASVAGTVLGDGATWDITGNQNWNTGSSFTAYTDSSNVTFNDTNNAHYNVTLNSTVAPLSTTINNSSGTYTISGSGTIAGPGSLTKAGSGTAMLSTANAYTGGTIVNGGTLTAGSAAAFGAMGTAGIGTGAKPGGTSVNTAGSLDLAGQALCEPITLHGGTLTNSSATTASVVGGVKGVGYTTTTAGISSAATISFNAGTAAVTPIFGITAASFSGFTGTYTVPTSTSSPPVTAPSVVITPSDGNGSGALAFAVLTRTALTGITIVSPGSGYDAAPVITFVGGNGTGGAAAGNANNFTIVGLETTATGSGYTSAPTATLHNTGASGAVTLTPVIGSVTLSSTSFVGGNAGDISLALPVTGAGGLIKTGSDTVTLGAANAYAGGTNVSAGQLTIAAPGALPVFATGGLDVAAGASAVAAVHAGFVKNDLMVSSLTLAGAANARTGKLELNNNDMIVQNGNLAALTNQVKQGFNGGLWQASGGICSTSAATDTTHLHALGVIQNSVDGTATGAVLYPAFDGAPAAAAGDVLTKYTYYGDANLDGKIDGTDYSRIDNGYLHTLTGWYNGEFNYDGLINGSDYTLLDNAFNTQGAQITSQIAASPAGTAVPEPAAVFMIGTIAISQLRRRRKDLKFH